MKPTWTELLAALRAGTASRGDLYGLSNLSRSQAELAHAAYHDLPVEARRRIVRTLVEIAEHDFEVNFGETFRLALQDADDDVRQMAIEGLWEDEDVRLVAPLVERLLEDSAAGVRAAAAASLGRFVLLGELGKVRERPYRQALDALLTAGARADETVEVRRRTVEALAYSGEETVAERIRAAYHDPDEQMRVSAVFAMGRNGDERWAAEVMRELNSPNPAMRYEATRACGELALADAVPALIELVDDVDAEVQEAAIWSLGQIGGDEARQVLLACSRSTSEALRQSAHEALRELEFLHGDIGAALFDLFDDEFDEEDEAEDEEEETW